MLEKIYPASFRISIDNDLIECCLVCGMMTGKSKRHVSLSFASSSVREKHAVQGRIVVIGRLGAQTKTHRTIRLPLVNGEVRVVLALTR